ncbi:PilZ domain-containing protein [uncultured Sphingomonas sp.]|uniref:PilZ domain-containing protein n=1 Tax=uncultured Sphingomonas sp. TaxID=158754 RepID=UPI0035C957AA
MKPTARRAFGTAPASGLRLEPRAATAVPATLHVEGADPRDVTIADITARGCRVSIVTDLRVATHVALMLDGTSLISGRVAWNDGAGIGIDFCAPLLPRIVARLTTR